MPVAIESSCQLFFILSLISTLLIDVISRNNYRMATDTTQDPLYQRLFRVFCWLSEGEVGLPPARAAFLIEETHRLSGHPSTSRRLAFNGENVSFRELLGLLENQFSNRKELESAALAVFERYVEQILLKGLAFYRRNRTKSCHPWRTKKSSSRWQIGYYSIGPGCIQLYHLKGEELRLKLKMPVDGSTTIQTFRSEADRNIIIISNGKQFIELSNFDGFHMNLIENAIKTCATYSSREALILADRRIAARFHGREAEIEAEEKLRLEREKAKLERDLEEERRALRDEEIVRGLATRMLEEERLKSEQIERVLQELQQKFHERERRNQPQQAEEEDYPEELMENVIEPSLERSVDYEDAVDAVEGEPHYESERTGEEGEVWQKEDFLILSTQSI